MAGTKKKTTAGPGKTPTAKNKPATRARRPGPAKVETIAPPREQQLLDGRGVSAAVEQLVQDVFREFPNPAGLVLLGIRTRGVFIAERMKERLDEKYGVPVGMGQLDITFYRDDLSQLGPDPMVRETSMPFDIDGANVILVDDVLYTGRTTRAAIDEICDFGRPALIRLATLVDRGLREYPLHADYCALNVQTTNDQTVHVLLEEVDDRDEVILAARE